MSDNPQQQLSLRMIIISLVVVVVMVVEAVYSFRRHDDWWGLIFTTFALVIGTGALSGYIHRRRNLRSRRHL